MNEREAASIVAIIAAAFPQWQASRETVAVYVDGLTDLDHTETLNATRDLLKIDDRWPSIATIRRRVATRLGSLAPSPAQAWGEVTRQADGVGRSSLPDWSHEAIGETVKAIGWFSICQSTNPDTMRAQFMRMYEDSQKRHDIDVLSTTGRIELDARRPDHERDRGPLAVVESSTA
jgi:uncharacterized protein (DUF1684 family)